MIKKFSNMDYNQKRERCGQYIEALEEERRKIHVFQRELPLCLDLVTQAIEACKRELPEMTTENMYGQPECSEQTTGECGPVLEQFLTIKDSSTSNEEEDEEFDDEHGNHDPDNDSEDKNTKSDWLKSVQLWNQPDHPLLPKEERLQQETMTRDESMRKDPMVNGGEGRKREAEKDGGGGRKQRRCWSSQLHRRFLNALQHLGGPHVATPKQIREFMKVDGLTNDEVKSHLQKYRLHTRRPRQTVPNNGNSQTQHFVVVGGLWVPQSDYSTGKTTGGATTSSTTTTTGIYGTMAAPPPPQWPSHSNYRPSIIVDEGSGSHSEGVVVRCSSPAMSSSTRNHYVKNN
ncbi:Transcription factor HRS1 [Arabidopsis thaliana]|jgi:SHAQKYF class myb-like DNA-binding protein|uniref:Transcription factor HRS1 n=5 Tax=Arabidopsis TaxID=3701 RepID=HRS1_ARATH|nr:myb-like transcription factor family protein [Arabidopsis thaliana]Q9FX67.1 RecName: Full=Transcription factor HRS1; AltName: Full=MYB-domain transcription factor HRS1; AltName: Full=NIGT1 protein homolog; Short=AtNIGT1; AltName: Full=Protein HYPERSENSITIVITY TO LOW PI-ELICITED PRIMARY ROOT SHORTENING 1 [Arabidopsis thaliana]KAG7596884.1 Homeobox-like domain superfamily [Arabidopsis suecica]KAG7646158.1 Homeobox-like domain superfamily [Arabidopsis thaliana x Arabidopsis arenosa]AAG09552.1 U|eukprot:NP_563926.1 myb-like transcription factor family protein [Arabidopsis thaliana]